MYPAQGMAQGRELDKTILARTTVSYETLLLRLLERAFNIRSRLNFVIFGRKIFDDELYTIGDYLEIIETLHIALVPHLRDKELEEQLKKIAEEWNKCQETLMEEGEKTGPCAVRVVDHMDKYLEIYLETLDKHNLLLRKQTIFLGGEK